MKMLFDKFKTNGTDPYPLPLMKNISQSRFGWNKYILKFEKTVNRMHGFRGTSFGAMKQIQ